MAKPRKRGNSYQLRCTVNGVTKTTSWKIPAGLTPKQAEKAAQKEQDKFEDLVSRGVNTDKVTFAEVAEQYIESIREDRKPTTVKTHEDRIRLINPYIGHVEVRKLTKQHIRDYIEELKKPYTTKKGIVKHRSSETIRDYYKTISAVLTFACEQDYLEDNICTQKGIKLPKQTDKKEKAIPIDTINGYLRLMETAPLQDRAFFLLTLYSGARKGEVLGLKWSNIDFEAEEVSFVDNCQYIAKQGIVYTTPKTGSSQRTVSLPPEVFTVLRQLRTQQKENRLKAIDQWEDCGRVFVNEIGRQVHPDTPRKNIQKMGEQAGLPKITVHQLRHTLVSLAIANGDPVTQIAAFVGHSSPRITTQVYAHEIRKAGAARSLNTNINNILKIAQ